MNMNQIEEQKIEQKFQELEQKIEVEEKLKPVALVDLMNKEFPATEWLIEHLIPSEAIVAISGAPAAFKTWLVLDLIVKVSQGDILFDKFITNQTGVLLVDEENGPRLLQTRFKKLNKSPNLPIYLLSLCDFKLTKESVEKLISFTKERGIKLVVFDSLVRIHSADENDASKMAGVFGMLKKFSKEGITVIFTHHNRKQGTFRPNPSQDMRGSSDILASVDCHLAVERKPKEDYLTITQTKLRQGEEMKPFKLNIINDDNEIRFEYAGEVDEIQNKKADCKEAIKEVLKQENRPLFGKELFERIRNAGIELGYSTFKSAVKEMLDKGELFEKKGERNKTFYSLERFEDIQEN
jgi:RecA-family ATPase